MQISVLKNLDEKLFGFRVDGDKFAVFSDLHLCSYFSREDYLKKAIKILEKEDIYTVFIAGDILEGHPSDDANSSKISGCYPQIDYAEKFFKKFGKGFTWLVIPGNHDLFYEYEKRQEIKKGTLIEEVCWRPFDMVYYLSYRLRKLENMYFYFISPEPTERYAMLVVSNNVRTYRIFLDHIPTENKKYKKYARKIKSFKPDIRVRGHFHRLKMTFLNGENKKGKRIILYPGCFQERTPYHKHNPEIGFAILDFSYENKVEIEKITF